MQGMAFLPVQVGGEQNESKQRLNNLQHAAAEFCKFSSDIQNKVSRNLHCSRYKRGVNSLVKG